VVRMTQFEVQEEARNLLRDFGVEDSRVSRVTVVKDDSTTARILLYPKRSWVEGLPPWVWHHDDWDDCDIEMVLNDIDLRDNGVSRYIRMHELGHIVWFFALREECFDILDKVISLMKDVLRGAAAKLLDMKIRKIRYNNGEYRKYEYYPFPSSSGRYTNGDAELFSMWFAWRMT